MMKAKSDLVLSNPLKTKSIILFLMILPWKVMIGQSTMPASGRDISGEGGSISYTIGQMTYTAHSGLTGTLNQGVQQPYEITVFSNLSETNPFTLEVTFFPNPVKDQLTLKLNDNNLSNLRYFIADVNGSHLASADVNSQVTLINMGEFPPAVYFITIKAGETTVTSFKILKK